jgi:hypothetical protein
MVKTRLEEQTSAAADWPLWKTCGRTVQTLWRTRGAKFFRGGKSSQVAAQTRRTVRLRTDLRLFRSTSHVESSLLRYLTDTSPSRHPHVDIHRYEEEIAGRTYHIEVHAVSQEQWRAKLARRPGMPTALMPFYGKTPELAARELTNWLSLVSASRPR